MNRNNEQDCLSPAELVRTEAAALEALAARLDGPMAAPFERAVDLVVRCGEGNGRVVVRYSGTEALARVMVEAEDEDTLRRLTDDIASEIQKALGV